MMEFRSHLDKNGLFEDRQFTMHGLRIPGTLITWWGESGGWIKKFRHGLIVAVHSMQVDVMWNPSWTTIKNENQAV